MPQLQAAALLRHQEEEKTDKHQEEDKTDKTKQAQIEQTYKKH